MEQDSGNQGLIGVRVGLLRDASPRTVASAPAPMSPSDERRRPRDRRTRFPERFRAEQKAPMAASPQRAPERSSTSRVAASESTVAINCGNTTTVGAGKRRLSSALQVSDSAKACYQVLTSPVQRPASDSCSSSRFCAGSQCNWQPHHCYRALSVRHLSRQTPPCAARCQRVRACDSSARERGVQHPSRRTSLRRARQPFLASAVAPLRKWRSNRQPPLSHRRCGEVSRWTPSKGRAARRMQSAACRQYLRWMGAQHTK